MPRPETSHLHETLRAFERRLGVSVTLHDYDGVLPELLPKSWFSHDRIEFCRAVKPGRHLACAAFDLKTLQKSVDRFPRGGWKCCGAGALEAFHPIATPDRVLGMVFIGVFTPGPGPVAADLSEKRTPRDAGDPPLPQLGLEGRSDVLAIAGVVARFIADETVQAGLDETGGLSRKALISRFLRKNYHRDISLADVASILGTSLSRASEIIIGQFGKGFPELVMGHRLERATRQLVCTSWPVHFVARECGFENTPYFNRVFRSHTGMTPGAWRDRHTPRPGAGAPHVP